MCHASDACYYDDKVSAIPPPEEAGRGNSDRGFSCAWSRSGCGRIRGCSASSWNRNNTVDPGPFDAKRNRTALSYGSAPPPDVDAAFAPPGCDDRNGGRATVQGAHCGNRRNQGRPGGGEFHQHETIDSAGRSDRHTLLADPTIRDCQSQCCPKPLADCNTPFCTQLRRPAIAGRRALASRAVQVTRWAAGRMGGPR